MDLGGPSDKKEASFLAEAVERSFLRNFKKMLPFDKVISIRAPHSRRGCESFVVGNGFVFFGFLRV